MSTTAGVGSQEYVAINPWSVATVVFGIASALALMEPVLLIIPLAGLVCGFMALPQIRHSNGTQTGRGLAWFGLVLSIGLTAMAIGKQVAAYAQDRRDTQQIAGTIDEVWRHVDQGQWDQAYALFDDRFHERVSAEQFGQRWKLVLNSPIGRIKSIRWNGVRPIFQADPDGTTRLAYVRVRIEFGKAGGQVPEDDLGFRRVNGQWRINNFPLVFPTQKPGEPPQ